MTPEQQTVTATDPTYEVPFGTVEIPVPCGPTTIQSFTVTKITRDNGYEDCEVTVTRSCGHPYFWSCLIMPEVGDLAMTCLGPQIETARSGRADPTVPPMKKGKRWTRLKGTVA